MINQKPQHLVAKTFSIAVAAASLLVTVPSFAGPNSAPSSKPATPVTETTPSSKPATPVNQTTTTSSPGTIAEVASTNSSFKTLAAAINAAGLTETLSGKGPFTVFAPTDAAFAALPKGTLEKLLKPENKATLQKILTYHVLAGSIDSKTIKSGQVKTVEGSKVNIQVKSAGVTVDKANVTTADVKASNGVIHAINKVLIPADVKL